MIRHMFVFGVLLPTTITIIVFVGFLICWFKFNIKDRVLKSTFFKKHFLKEAPTNTNDATTTVQSSTTRRSGGHHKDPENRQQWQPLTDNPSHSDPQRHLLGQADYVVNERHLYSVRDRADTPDQRYHGNELVPQTYQFPELGGSGGRGHTDDNYGHFVPTSQLHKTSEQVPSDVHKMRNYPPIWANPVGAGGCRGDQLITAEKYNGGIFREDGIHGGILGQDSNNKIDMFPFYTDHKQALLTGI